MADNPSTSSGDEPSDIDIGAARQAFVDHISLLRDDPTIRIVDAVDVALINAVAQLYALLEHETRRIDNELTQAVTPPEA